MRRQTWKKHHKVTGIAAALFLLLFCISGFILNHRSMYSTMDISRRYLPSQYHYQNWNMGLIRGGVATSFGYFWYGDGGLFTPECDEIHEANSFLPPYSDHRHIRNVTEYKKNNSLYIAAQYGLYRMDSSTHEEIKLPLEKDERLVDVATLGDSLIVISRDRIFISTDGADFEPIELIPGSDWDGKFTLFRYLWLLHSGQMWGLPGKVVVDIVGVTFVFLTLSGLVFWLWPMRIRRLRDRGLNFKHTAKTLAWNARWHIKIGVWAFVVLCFVVVTGWCLRPPLLIPFVLTKVPGIEGTALSPSKPWADKLRALRWDSKRGWWLLSTSDGFYRVGASLRGTPQKLDDAPNVSVMGVTVLQQEPDGKWLVGSLSGMYRWNPDNHEITDYFTGELADNKPGAPFGKRPVAGYSALYQDGELVNEVVYDYYQGASAGMYEQPDSLCHAPISLWNFALEVHTGRIYNLFGHAPLIWIFLAGSLIFYLILTGYKSRPKREK